MQENKQVIDPQRYSVIPRTLIFIFDSQNRLLLLKGALSKKIWPGLYNGIGGHVEVGEDILEAAERELNEETGFTKVDLQFCGQVMIDVSKAMGIAMFVFRGMYKGEEIVPSNEGTLEWVLVDDLEKLPVVEDLPILIPKIIDYQPSAPIIIGKYVYDQDGGLNLLFQ